MTAELQAFLDGPLSDPFGGSAGAREHTWEIYQRDIGEGDRTQGHGTKRPNRFVLESPSPLFSYQREIVDDLHTWFGQRGARQGALVSLPTGGGKTRTAVWFARELAEQGLIGRLLWVAAVSRVGRTGWGMPDRLVEAFPRCASRERVHR